jgi:hypothetical protein
MSNSKYGIFTPEEFAPKRKNKTPGDQVQSSLMSPWWRDPATIPKRKFLYGQHHVRGEVVATIGAGGRGKTTLNTCEAVSMAVGRNLMTGEPLPDGPLRVWVLNAEEDQDELDRRFAATCQHYGIKEADLGGRLFAKSVRASPWRLATLINNAPTIDQEVIAMMKDFIKTNQIDVFTVDPLISFHAVDENSNADMDLLIKEGFGAIAGATNTAGEILHHPGKPKPGLETTVNDGRGASAIIWAVRSARVLNFMTPEEARKIGIAENVRRRYVSIINGKANMGPVGRLGWMKIELEILPKGDEVACSTLWKPPDPFQGITPKDVEVARNVAQGGAHRADSQSPQWFGFAIAKHLNINIQHDADNAPQDLARLKAVIKTWVKNGVLAVDVREDEKRKKRKYIIPGQIDLLGENGIADDELA